METHEIWERRPGGAWRSVYETKTRGEALDYMQRRIRTGKSLHFGTTGPTEYVALPVGDHPYPDTAPYSFTPRKGRGYCG